jgi:hypothetical protein
VKPIVDYEAEHGEITEDEMDAAYGGHVSV